MIVFPPEFRKTKYPGYFWNVDKQRLYSIKVTGALRPLTLIHPNRFNEAPEDHYRISVKGEKRYLPLSYLRGLKSEPDKVEYVEVENK